MQPSDRAGVEVVIRDGRLYWPGRTDAPEPEPTYEDDYQEAAGATRYPWRDTIRNNTLLIVVFLYLLFNWGFQQVRIPPVAGGGLPVGEIVLFMALATINYTRTLGLLHQTVYLVPFAIWWFFGLGRAMLDFSIHGAWALRDAAHVIESLFILAGFVFASDPRYVDKFFKWLPRFLVLGVIYAAFYPMRDVLWSISPTIIAGNGLVVPVFGSMSNTAFVVILAAFYLILFHSGRFLANLVAMLLIGYVIVLFQARTNYLVLIAVFGFILYHRRSSFGNLGLLAIIGGMALALVTLLGVQIQGRLGETFSLDFLIEHFLAIFGYGSTTYEGVDAAAEGVGQRIEWWMRILGQLTDSAYTLLLGMGYGVPLTNFSGHEGVIVREPHNSYVTIFARTGIIGGIAWFWMMGILFLRWVRSFNIARAVGWREGENRFLILMVFFISCWVLALGEDGFEKPYNIIPFYFFWGIALRMSLQLERDEIGPMAEPAEEPVYPEPYVR